jgi:single-stranded-DNA-specific exonuclease
VKFPEIVGAGGHVRFTLAAEDGARLRAVAFRAAETALGHALLSAGDTPMHVAGSLTIDHWQGREEARLRVADIAQPARN